MLQFTNYDTNISLWSDNFKNSLFGYRSLLVGGKVNTVCSFFQETIYFTLERKEVVFIVV